MRELSHSTDDQTSFDTQTKRRKHRGPFLLCRRSQLTERHGPFNTEMGHGSDDEGDPSYASLLILPVAKREGGLYPERIFIGRTRRSDVTIPHHSVSKTHAYFTIERDQYFIVDAGSTNGTFVRGVQLEKFESAPLRNGDRVRLGPVIMHFCWGTRLEGVVAHRTEAPLKLVETGVR